MISILYVDDEPDLLDLAQIFLEQTGVFRVRTATSAEEILADPGILAFDAILSDYQMPGMDGIAFLKEIRKKAPDLPFLLFTGRGREEIVIEALNNGADFYIQKGGDPRAQFAELANKVRYAVQKKTAERELVTKRNELQASYEQITANEEELRQQLEELGAKQEALRESEERFRAFTENVPDLTTIADMTGRYTYISPSIQRITGRSAEEMLGKNYRDAGAVFGILPEDAEILVKSGKAALEQSHEAIVVPPFRLRTARGTMVYLEGTMTFLPDIKGIQGLLFHGRDITDRIHAEEALQKKNEELLRSYEQITASEEELKGQFEALVQSEARVRESETKFRGIFEKSRDAHLVFTDWKCVDCNQPAVSLFGYSRKEELIGLHPKDFFPSTQPDERDSAESAADLIRRILQKGSEHLEWVHKRKDGSTFPADTLISVFELDEQMTVLVSVRDISDRKRTEEELELLKISVDRSSDEVFWMDFGGSILYVNDAACRTTGYSREELCSMKLFELDPDIPREVWDASVTDLRARKTQFIQTRHQRKDGTLIDVEIVAIYVNKGDREYSFAFVRDITGRKRTEQTLAESEERYRTLVEMSPVAVIVHRDGEILYVNPETVRLAKAGGPMDLIGKDVLSFIHPDDLALAREHFLRLSEGKTIPATEERLLALDGEEFIVEIAAQPIRYEGVRAVLVVFRDITLRKRTEQILIESEERYRTLVDSSFDGIAIHQDGKLVFVNQTGVHMMGLSDPEGLIGRPAIEIIHPDDRSLIAERIRVSPQQSLELIHERFLRPDGSIMHVDVASTPCTWQGRPATYVTFRDISVQKKADEALRESEENYRSLIELAPVAVVVHRNGKNVYANPEAVRMVKAQGPEDIIGKDILAFICPEDQAQTLDSVSRIAGDRVTFPRQEKHIIAVDGEVLTVEIAAKPVNFQGLPSIMVLMRDISEQKKTEDALFDSRQMLQTVLDTIPQRVFWKDKNSVFLGCNKANARDAGFADPAQMVGKSDYDYTSTEVAELYRADDRRVMETGQGRINYEEPQARPDGGRAWLRTSKVPLRDKKGTVVGVLGTYEDITEYKQSQEALRESEEKYRLLVETTSDFIWEVDTEGKYTYISPKIRDILGFDPEEIIGKTPFDLMTSYDTSRIAAEFLDYVKKEEPFSGLVNANHHKDGSTVIIETSAAPFFDRNGAFAGYRGIDRDITKRTKIEEALRESEEKYRTLVENASEVIAIVQDWKIVFVNRQGAQLIGKTPAELTGRLFMDFIWPEDRERLNEIHGTWVTGGPAPETYDFRIIGAGEKPVWVSNSITAISWEGKPAALSLMTNITERKVAEAALQESEATFRSVIEGAPEAIYIGADWNFQYLNPAALRLFGASSGEQLIGTPFMDRIHPKFHDVIRERVVGLYDERVAAPPLEEVYLKLDGSEIEVEVSSVPFRYKGNDGALVFIWDITDRKKAEQARLESEAEYRRILDTMQDAYIRADTVGKIITVNPSAARMFGYASPGEMRGIPVSALYSHPAKRQEIVTRLEREGMVADAVELLLRMDSTTFWASINVQALRGEDGQLVGTEGIIRDITERKALEQAIEDTNKKLSLLNSITRHDVANQLTALRGYAQLAELSNPDPVVLDFLQKIETATDTIAGQIEFTKAYQELGEKTPAWFRIDAIVEKTARDGVTFSNTCRAIEIFADPMIERVFYNLFDNAIRHGDHVTTIGVRCERAPDGLVIYVEDDGIGVVPEEKEKIFEKGFGKNTGFGLFLAREILATTGITIRETGYVGVGARFEITVPREMWRIFPGG